MHTTSLPTRRQVELTTQQVGNETLVYDERAHKAFCLNSVAAEVWKQCEGTRTVAEIARAVSLHLSAPVTEEVVAFTLAELGRDGLLEAQAVAPESMIPIGISRRALVKKLGVSAAIALPVITAIVAPQKAQASRPQVVKPVQQQSAKPVSPSSTSGAF